MKRFILTPLTFLFLLLFCLSTSNVQANPSAGDDLCCCPKKPHESWCEEYAVEWYKGANPNDVRPIEEDLTAYIPDKKDKKRDAFPTSIVVEEIRFFSSQPPQTIYYNKNHYYGYIPWLKYGNWAQFTTLYIRGRLFYKVQEQTIELENEISPFM